MTLSIPVAVQARASPSVSPRPDYAQVRGVIEELKASHGGLPYRNAILAPPRGVSSGLRGAARTARARSGATLFPYVTVWYTASVSE